MIEDSLASFYSSWQVVYSTWNTTADREIPLLYIKIIKVNKNAERYLEIGCKNEELKMGSVFLWLKNFFLGEGSSIEN